MWGLVSRQGFPQEAQTQEALSIYFTIYCWKEDFNKYDLGNIYLFSFGEDDIVALLCWHGLSQPTMSGYPCTLTFECLASFSGSGGSQPVRQAGRVTANRIVIISLEREPTPVSSQLDTSSQHETLGEEMSDKTNKSSDGYHLLLILLKILSAQIYFLIYFLRKVRRFEVWQNKEKA